MGNDFKICSNIQVDAKNERWVDWVLCHEDVNIENIQKDKLFLLPYDVQDLSRFMYIAGNYWVAKKEVMKEFPLNESLVWNQAEDIEWSRRVRNKYNFSFNKNSTIKFLKEKGNPFNLVTQEIINILSKNVKSNR